MKKYIYFILIIVVLLLVSSCSKEKNSETEDRENSGKKELHDKVLLILGEDYENRSGIPEYLERVYTVESVAKNLHIFKYSEFFANTKRARLKAVVERIDEILPSVVISLGIPEGAGKYLFQAAEKYPLMAILSLLPMEEVLLLEAVSDIVVDFELPDILLNQESDFKISDDDVSILILASVFCGEDINSAHKKIDVFPIEEFRRSFYKAEKIFYGESKNYSIKPYSDPETGISSYKYLVIYEQENKKSENAEFNIFKKD